MDDVVAFAPGRVNLIGDHTDHTGGWCLPIALDRGVTVRGERGGTSVELRSDHEELAATVPLDVTDPRSVTPAWAAYVAGVVAQIRPAVGLRGSVSSDLPIGAGLSSSAALEVAVALALGARGTPLDIALLCQRAEREASGVPCGILDQLASTSGVAGHALLMDCTAQTTTPVPVPDDLEFVVVHSGQTRSLATSDYARRRDECERAERIIGPLRTASLEDLAAIPDETLRRRAHHVITENARVWEVTAAFAADDAGTVGDIFATSHASLRDDFECSTPMVDATVERLVATPGVHGARMSGGGWGGCVVAATERGALDEGWVVRPGGPATTRAGDASPPRTPRD